ncbi:CvpA family protein [Desertibaculum subflavum]|uniref:CvpA family protein n=1 Tax=Desertibaculum subflavum TaxID=2268458 RepID=UPI000E66DC6D
MDSLPINLIDLAVIAILLISGFFAFVRGFVREVLSVAGWVGAGIITLYLFDPVRPHVRGLIPSPLIADIVTGAGIFIVALVVLSILSHYVAERVRDSMIGPIDRSLGFVFGLVRGAVLCAAAFLLFSWLVARDDRPQVIATARSLPLLEQGSNLLLRILPESARRETEKAVGTGSARVKDAAEGAEALRRAGEAIRPPSADTAGEKGYKPDERRALDNLIRGSQ